MLSWLLTSFTHKLLSDGGRCPAASFPLLGQHCFSETSPKADAAQSSVCPFSGPPPQPLGVLVFRTGTTDGSLYCSSVLLGQSEWLWRNKASPRQICHGTPMTEGSCVWMEGTVWMVQVEDRMFRELCSHLHCYLPPPPPGERNNKQGFSNAHLSQCYSSDVTPASMTVNTAHVTASRLFGCSF